MGGQVHFAFLLEHIPSCAFGDFLFVLLCAGFGLGICFNSVGYGLLDTIV